MARTRMSKRTLFAYFEDGHLEGVAEEYLDLLRDFVAERRWRGDKPYVVNQPVERPSALERRSPPEWDLGLHLPLAAPGAEPPHWFDDVEAIVAFLVRLRQQTGRSFVVGIFDWEGRYAEELCYVNRSSPDVARLRGLVGAEQQEE